METTELEKSYFFTQKHHTNWKDDLGVPSGCIYPDLYQFTINLPGVGTVLIRPITGNDASLFEDFFNRLSPRSVYLRFFSFLKQLPPNMLKKFTEIDYKEEIALIAIKQEEPEGKIIGDARVIQTEHGISAEFSILITDQWQGKGIGACLLRHCFDIAKDRGFKKIHGIVLAENRNMLALARKLNFTIKHVAQSSEYELIKVLE